MPLIIDIPRPRPGLPALQLIIDRNFVIFNFPRWNEESTSPYAQACFRQRGILANFFDRNFTTLNDEIPGHVTESNEHIINEHLSEHDKQGIHFHILYNKDVDFAKIKKIFDDIDLHASKDPSIYNVIAPPQARAGFLEAIKGYFDQLENDPKVKQIEQEYRQEKVMQYEKAKIESQKEATRNNGASSSSTESLDEKIMLLTAMMFMNTPLSLNTAFPSLLLTNLFSSPSPAGSKAEPAVTTTTSPTQSNTTTSDASAKPKPGFNDLFAQAMKRQQSATPKTQTPNKATTPAASADPKPGFNDLFAQAMKRQQSATPKTQTPTPNKATTPAASADPKPGFNNLFAQAMKRQQSATPKTQTPNKATTPAVSADPKPGFNDLFAQAMKRQQSATPKAQAPGNTETASATVTQGLTFFNSTRHPMPNQPTPTAAAPSSVSASATTEAATARGPSCIIM
ncbi:MAG: hypothetical protein P4M14_02260 [Gammaproteobacteria bacterium]|nr:hypothetical protein [Gammaproteobacteria bacterium]